MNSVFSRSIESCDAPRSTSGWVESSTCRRSPSGISPNERRITSGPSDEPPIPSSTASVNPSAPALLGELVAAPAACSSIVSETVSQPSRSSISGTPGPPHSDGSRRQTRCGDVVADRLLDPRGDRLHEVGRRSAPGSCSACPVSTAARRSSIPASSRFDRVLELLDAFGQQLLGDLRHVDPGVGQRLQVVGWVELGGGAR